jgi:hypothetical protein
MVQRAQRAAFAGAVVDGRSAPRCLTAGGKTLACCSSSSSTAAVCAAPWRALCPLASLCLCARCAAVVGRWPLPHRRRSTAASAPPAPSLPLTAIPTVRPPSRRPPVLALAAALSLPPAVPPAHVFVLRLRAAAHFPRRRAPPPAPAIRGRVCVRCALLRRNHHLCRRAPQPPSCCARPHTLLTARQLTRLRPVACRPSSAPARPVRSRTAPSRRRCAPPPPWSCRRRRSRARR